MGCAWLLVDARAALRLLIPALLVLTVAFGQAASAHIAGGQHQSLAGQAHAEGTMSHHGGADVACCDDVSQDEDGRACLAQCLTSCSYCAPLPLPATFPELTAMTPAPAASDPLRGSIASPAPRPPAFA